MKNSDFILIFILILVFITSCSSNNIPADNNSNSPNQIKYSNYTLPITSRSFYIGLVPTPKSIPNTTFDDITNAYKELPSLGEVSMVWVDPITLGEYEKLKQNRIITALRVYNIKPIITLNFADIKEDNGLKYVIASPSGKIDEEFKKAYIDEARNIASEFKPEYFSLGNEINDYFYLHPEDLDSYISLFDETYAEIKKVSPDTKVFVVFSYNHLIENNQWDMLSKFSRADLIGITTYPWKTYNNPEDIPNDYYTRLSNYTTKPIAFTEIGWPGEKQQPAFLLRFLDLTKNMKIEMVNWLFLHEIKLTGITAFITDTETSTISLKRADGTEKDIYNLWLDLKGLKYTPQTNE